MKTYYSGRYHWITSLFFLSFVLFLKVGTWSQQAIHVTLILESSSIKHLQQPTTDHKHPACTTPSPSTSNLRSLDNSLKFQVPFYPSTHMFSFSSQGQILPLNVPTRRLVISPALPVTTPLSWPSDTTVSFPSACPTAESLLRSGSSAKSSSSCFCVVWESWQRGNEFCDLCSVFSHN